MMSAADPIEDAVKKLNNQGIDFLKKFLIGMAISLIRPIATTTEKLYRVKMGERYFSAYNMFAGIGLIVAASLPQDVYDTHRIDPTKWNDQDWVAILVGGFWGLWLFFASLRHFRSVKKRYKLGEVMHTYYHGTIIKPFSYLPVSMVPFVCMVVGFFAMGFSAQHHNHPLGRLAVLFMFSGIFSHQMRVHEARTFRTMVLDTMDAHIAQKHLANAVAQRMRPEQAEGLMTPLPAYVSDKYRERFARAVSPASSKGNPFTAPAPTVATTNNRPCDSPAGVRQLGIGP